MYSVELDAAKRLLVISAVGHVSGAEVTQAGAEIEERVENAAPGFAVLVDFRFVDLMKPDTARHIGEIMDLLARKQVANVVRIIPDSSKDVGMNILSHLHYDGSKVEITTVTTLAEAIVLLAGP